MGLSGSGKSELAKELHNLFQNDERSSIRINGDEVREAHKDWDFSPEGRIRQAERMAKLAKKSNIDYVIADFVAPLAEMRENCTFVRITGAGLKESHVHDVQITRESPNYRAG